MKKHILKLICLILTLCMVMPMLASCELEDILSELESQSESDTTLAEEDTTDGDGVTTDDVTTDGENDETTAGEDVTTDDVTTDGNDDVTTDGKDDVTTEEETTTKENVTTVYDPVIEGLDIDSANLHGNMQNIFAGDTVKCETVMFINKGETKQLLFPIDEIIAVQDYVRRKTYQEGRDYQVIDGKLYIPTTSTMSIITSSTYYNFTGQDLLHEQGYGSAPIYWGEGTTMTQWQLSITYKHSKTWSGFEQESYAETYEGLIRKLMAGDDLTFIFYGDSITCGATSSWYVGVPTNDWYVQGKAFSQGSYSMLFTQALADLFGYKIEYVDVSSLNSIIKAPPETYVSSTYVEGVGGTITYINPSVGGWTSANGVSNFDNFVGKYITQYGCDLLGVAFGMNDGNVAVSTTANNIKTIYQKAMALDNDFYGMIVSTMVPNNISTNGWYGNQYKQEAALEGVAEYLNSNGVNTGISRMTSVSLAVLTRKDFRDSTGNNINHPNDFMHRIYAQTCLQAFIGYENMR